MTVKNIMDVNRNIKVLVIGGACFIGSNLYGHCSLFDKLFFGQYLAMISIAEALRYWEQKGHLRKRQCICLTNLLDNEKTKKISFE